MLLSLLLVVLVKILYLFLVLPRNLADKHTVIRSLAVFEQDCENLPDVGDDGELLFCVCKTIFDELVEANGIDEERLVDAVDGLGREPLTVQLHSLYAIATDRFLVLRLQNDARNV